GGDRGSVSRCIAPIYSAALSARSIGSRDRRWGRRARAGDPRPPPRGPDPRLRTAQTTGPAARRLPVVLLRLAVPGAAPPHPGRPHRRGGRGGGARGRQLVAPR